MSTIYHSCKSNFFKFLIGVVVVCNFGTLSTAFASNIDQLLKSYYQSGQKNKATAQTVSAIIHEYLIQDQISDSAIMWADTLRNIGELLHLEELIAKSDLFTGKYYLRQSDDAKALEYFYRALTYYKKTENDAGIADVYLQIGLVYYLQAQFADAISNIQFSSGIYEKLGNDSSFTTSCYLLGLSYMERNELKPAENYLLKALSSSQKLISNDRTYEIKVALARLYTRQKRYNEADSLFQLVLQHWNAQTDPYGFCMTLIPYANLMMETHHYNEAYTNMMVALNIARKYNLSRFIVEIYQLLQNYYEHNGNYEQAYWFQKMHYQLRDSIFNSNNQRTITALKAKLESERRQSQINALEQKAKANRLQKLLLALAIVMLLGLSLGLYRRYQYKQKKENELYVANKELSSILNELKQTQQQLIHTEKMASLGRMSSGLAHELRNPLNFVINFTKVSSELLHELDNTPIEKDKSDYINTLKKNLTLVYQHALRAEKIILSLVNHSKPKTANRSVEDLNKLICEFSNVAYKSYTTLFPDFNCTIHFDKDKSLKEIRINAQEIMIVLLNILNNAFEAMHEKSLDDKTYKPLLKISTRKNQNHVTVTISDNGPGISDELIARVFEPFFTTKQTTNATGLGLSLAYEIIQSHNGSLEVKSIPHLETEFKFNLNLNESISTHV